MLRVGLGTGFTNIDGEWQGLSGRGGRELFCWHGCGVRCKHAIERYPIPAQSIDVNPSCSSILQAPLCRVLARVCPFASLNRTGVAGCGLVPATPRAAYKSCFAELQIFSFLSPDQKKQQSMPRPLPWSKPAMCCQPLPCQREGIGSGEERQHPDRKFASRFRVLLS